MLNLKPNSNKVNSYKKHKEDSIAEQISKEKNE